MSERKELERTDAEAREAALTEFAIPLVVEAGAGTGKTTTLVGRLLAWCLGPGWTEAGEGEASRQDPDAIVRKVLDGVIALTFTEAAAAEMAKRTAEWLTEIASGRGKEIRGFPLETIGLPASPELERRAASLLDQLDLLTIRTVHSFCHGLLAQYPFAAGVHPRLEVDSDGYRTEQLVFEQVEASFPRWAREQPSVLSLLAHARIGPRILAQGTQELLEKGVPEGSLSQQWFTREGLLGLARRARARIDALVTVTRPFASLTGKNSATLDFMETLREAEASLSSDVEIRTETGLVRRLDAAVKRLTEGGNPERLRAWSKGRFNKGESKALSDKDIPAIAAASREVLSLSNHLSRLDPDLFDALRDTLAPIVSAVRRDLRSRGLITFHDLLAETVRLLTNNPDVTSRLRKRTRQLLVDEVQDTDPIQYEIIKLLALGKDPRPGLFLVGDPKQSIYGWRQADLGAYEAFLGAIKTAGGRVMRLSANFRSSAAILDEVKRSVAPVMRPEAGVQPSFFELLPAREKLPAELSGGRRPVEYWISWPKDPAGRFTKSGEPPSDAAARIEARAIANDLLDLHQEHGVCWQHCGILLRSRNRFDIYLDALRERSIPFSVSRDTLYYQRREVIDAAALIRLVVDPSDRLALLTWLRSPFVGVPDAALLPLWRERFPEVTESLAETRGTSGLAELIQRARTAIDPQAAPTGDLASWDIHLEHACYGLASLRRSFDLDAADTFVERLRIVTQLEATAAARFQGRHRLANIERLLQRVESALEEGGGDSQRLLRTLRRGVAEAQEEEEARPSSEGGETVSLLTIHGAKGLEFPYLWVANLGASARSGRPAVWDVGTGAGLDAGCEVVLHGAPSPGWDEIEGRRMRTAEAERVRTLYVAMTRAAERLVLLGGWHRDGAGKHREGPPSDHLSLLAHRRGGVPDLATLWRQSEESGESGFVDEEGVRWVFPELDPLLGAREKIQTAPTDTVTAAEVRREAVHLAEQRSAAALRMKRRFSDAPSRLASGGGAPGDPDFPPSLDNREIRKTAAELGTRVHHLFESWNLAAEPDGELERQRLQLLAHTEDRDPNSTRAANELLDRLASGSLWRRFAALGDRVVARELPMLLPGAEEGDGPIGYLSGKIDMIYRRDDEALVIVDYKTDRVEGDEAIETRAAEYAPQAEAYRRAVTEALALAVPPRFELWFLWPDRIVEL